MTPSFQSAMWPRCCRLPQYPYLCLAPAQVGAVKQAAAAWGQFGHKNFAVALED